MSDKPYCPWCGRNMDELENGKIDGHAWYRDDSDYIQNIERSRNFMKKRIEQLERLCLHMFLHGTWRIGKLISKGPYSAGAISQLDEDKLEVWMGQYEKSMIDLGLWESEQQ